jgi:hypothetical protein
VHWLGRSRTGRWHLWQCYRQYGVEAIFAAESSGARAFFPPLHRVQIARVACTDPAAFGLHQARWGCRSLQHVVVEQAVVGSIHDTTIARTLAAASLQPHRRRYWKTATIDARFTTQAAKTLWRYERVEWLNDQGEVVLCVDEKPHMQVRVRRGPTQPMRRRQIARREFEYKRDGTVTFLTALNVYDGTMWGCCLKAHDHVHFLRALGRLARRYPWARRRPLIMDNDSSTSPTKPGRIWPVIRACGRSIPRRTLAGFIEWNCCCAPFRINICGALIPPLGSI